ncbi:MAG: DUF547 domain-containing protein [Pseudomonadota bacterium]
MGFPKILIALVAALLVDVAGVAAAPIWIERLAIPDPELVDPVFQEAAATETMTPDYRALDAFLARYRVVGETGVALIKYGGVAPDDVNALGAFIDALVEIDVRQLTRDQQLSYWINLYNAVTLREVIAAYPVETIREIKIRGDGVWKATVVTVNGVGLSLGDIEHGILRAIYGEPRIHYAINCASIGCPNIAETAYRSAVLEEMLTRAARDYVNHPRGVFVKGRLVKVSSIFGWFREDFGADEAEVVEHIKQYAEQPLVDALIAAKNDIDTYDYDWAINVAP